MLSFARRVLKRFHPEGIPWPGSVLYDMLSRSRIFQHHYQLAAQDIAANCSGGRILDVGTGPGRLLLRLRELAPDLELTGVDISADMVEQARRNVSAAGLSESIALALGTAQSLPFTDSAFDAVVSTGSMHHWQDIPAGLDEAYRVLKPGGRALIYDLVTDIPRETWQAAVRDFGRLRMTLYWLHSFEEPFYTWRDLEALAGKTRFGGGRARFVGVLCCLDLRKP